jgi:hypothetical protein
MTLPRRLRRSRRGRAVTVALYLNAALLAGVLVTMLARDGRSLSLLSTAYGADGPAMGGGGNLYVIPGQFAERRYGCYLMDTDAQTLCVYQFEGSGQKLKLIAARNFRHDRRLGHLNTEPDPKEIEVMVEGQRAGRGGSVDAAPAGAPKSGGTQD